MSPKSIHLCCFNNERRVNLWQLDPDTLLAHAWLDAGHFCWRQKVSALQCTLSLSPPSPALIHCPSLRFFPLHLSPPAPVSFLAFPTPPLSHANSYLCGLKEHWYIIISWIFNWRWSIFHHCPHFFLSLRLYFTLPSPFFLEENSVTSEGGSDRRG